jgi:hypothetical protein
VKVSEKKDDAPVLSTAITHVILPVAGSCIVFSHHLLHQGGAIEVKHNQQPKWILRTEVCFKRTEIPVRPPEQTRAFDFLEQARVAENHQDFERATQCYRSAFKLWPELNKFVK